ncbi:MAG: hypothetical protein QW379_02110 [Thermoplasmata archaeon]
MVWCGRDEGLSSPVQPWTRVSPRRSQKNTTAMPLQVSEAMGGIRTSDFCVVRSFVAPKQAASNRC